MLISTRSKYSILLLSYLIACGRTEHASQVKGLSLPIGAHPVGAIGSVTLPFNTNVIGHSYNLMNPALETLDDPSEVQTGELCVEYVDDQNKVVSPTNTTTNFVKTDSLHSFEDSQDITAISNSSIKFDGKFHGEATIPQLAGANIALDADGNFKSEANYSSKNHQLSTGVNAALVVYTNDFSPPNGARPRIRPDIVADVLQKPESARAQYFFRKCGSAYIGKERRGAYLKAEIAINSNSSDLLENTTNELGVKFTGKVTTPELGSILGDVKLDMDAEFDNNGHSESGQINNRTFTDVKLVSNGIDYVEFRTLRELVDKFTTLHAIRGIKATVPLEVTALSYMQTNNWSQLGIDGNQWAQLGEDVSTRMYMRQNLDNRLIDFDRIRSKMITLRSIQVDGNGKTFEDSNFEPKSENFSKQIGHSTFAIRAIEAAKKCLQDLDQNADLCMNQEVQADQTSETLQKRDGLMYSLFILDRAFESNAGNGKKRFINLDGMPLPAYVLPRMIQKFDFTIKNLFNRFASYGVDASMYQSKPEKHGCSKVFSQGSLLMTAVAPGGFDEWDIVCSWTLDLGRMDRSWTVEYQWTYTTNYDNAKDTYALNTTSAHNLKSANSGLVKSGEKSILVFRLEPDANLFKANSRSNVTLTGVQYTGPLPHDYLKQVSKYDVFAGARGDL